MIYSNWMSYIKDDAKINKIVIPGAHNAGSYVMNRMACCQEGDLYKQYEYGIRHFCIRLDTASDGTIVLAHGITKGASLESVLYQFRKMLHQTESEFFIFDIREYYDQKIGTVTMRYKADPNKVDELLAEYIEPEKYAFWDFDNISDVTLGDIRRSGKRYIILNEKKDYKYSCDCPCIFPWNKKAYGCLAPEFTREIIKIFDENSTEGFYWFQTQQTPNLGTQVGVVTPIRLDMSLRPYYKSIIEQLAADPQRLDKVNIIAGDFMTYDHSKVRDILRLNLVKQIVKPGLEAEFEKKLFEKN
ncbi:MAG: hypothetical protein LUG85_01245 [Clostridiales bacterium]|nr:hypothetical protein [Clostridiales bacterium]